MKRSYIRITVSAGSRRESLAERGGRLLLTVREKAELNAANGRARALVARHFSVPLRAVRIISGHHRAQKIVEVLY